MKEALKLFQMLSDETRMRILMLLTRRELCVCQLMAVLDVSQPLVSRNLFLLDGTGLLNRRREGKMLFYSVKKNLPAFAEAVFDEMKRELKDDETFVNDLKSLVDCTEFQKRTGRCDMKAFHAFMAEQRKKRLNHRISR